MTDHDDAEFQGQSSEGRQLPRIHFDTQTATVVPRQWGEDAQQLMHGVGRWRLLGTAGSGVSSLLVDTAVARLEEGVPIEKILIVTSSKKAAFQLRQDMARRLPEDLMMTTPVVRSVTSLAFWLLQKLADEKFGLLPGAQFDAIIQDLLRGDLQDHPENWPEELRPALPTVSFARDLKDFLLQVMQRDISADELCELGQTYNEPAWTAAGVFLSQLQEVMSLQDSESEAVHQYVEAELSGAAVRAWNSALKAGGFSLEREELPFDTILIDNAQHLNPRGAQLLSYLIAHAQKVVIAGDPDQSVFRFRGANNDFLLTTPVDEELTLTKSFRQPETRLVEVASSSALRNLTVDCVRRAHLLEGKPWKDMAVIVRSARDIPPLHRALTSSGVPVHLDSANLLLTEHPLVSNLLLALKSVVRPLTPTEVEKLGIALIREIDATSFRRIYRVLQRYEEICHVDEDDNPNAANLTPEEDGSAATKQGLGVRGGRKARRVELLSTLLQSHEPIADSLKQFLEENQYQRDWAPFEKLKRILDAGYTAKSEGKGADLVLWEMWDELGLEKPLQNTALRGGVRSAQAEQDLDAVIDLFDALADFLKLKPQAGVADFLAHITSQELPTGVRDRRQGDPDAVTVVTAHGAIDGQWKNVIVAGVQSNEWPKHFTGGGVFHEDAFLDLIDENIDPTLFIDRAVENTAEERRLLHVAVTRAHEQLLVLAVNSELEETMPSRLFYELREQLQLQGDEQAHAKEEEGNSETESVLVGDADIRVLDAPSLIAELRRVVTSDLEPDVRRQEAAKQLARLALSGFSQADPEEWWTTKKLSSTTPIESNSLSPSQVGAIWRCPLQAVSSRFLPQESTVPMQKGNLLHLYAEAVAHGDDAAVKEEIVKAYERISHPAVWKAEVDHQEFEESLERTKAWILGSQEDHYQLAGAEMPVDVELNNGVRVRGKIDRLEENISGTQEGQDSATFRIVDFKSGGNKKKDEYDFQIALYDLALNEGKIEEGKIVTSDKEEGLNLEDSILFFPKDKKSGPVYGEHKYERVKPALDQDQRENFEKLVGLLSDDIQGSSVVARDYSTFDSTCKYCKVRSLCPLKNKD